MTFCGKIFFRKFGGGQFCTRFWYDNNTSRYCCEAFQLILSYLKMLKYVICWEKCHNDTYHPQLLHDLQHTEVCIEVTNASPPSQQDHCHLNQCADKDTDINKAITCVLLITTGTGYHDSPHNMHSYITGFLLGVCCSFSGEIILVLTEVISIISCNFFLILLIFLVLFYYRLKIVSEGIA